MRVTLPRLLLMAAAVACAVAGCEQLFGDGYTWYMRGPPATSRSWHTRERLTMYDMCGWDPVTSPGLNACAQYDFAGGHCFIWSTYTEAQAKVKKTNGRTLFEHEVGTLLPDGTYDPAVRKGHCAGFDHREKHVRSV